MVHWLQRGLALLELFIIFFDDALILAVGGYEHLRFPEQPVERKVIVYQQSAGR